MENGKVPSNPARLIRLREEHNARMQFLSRAEYAELLGIIQRNNPQTSAHVQLLAQRVLMSEYQYYDFKAIDHALTKPVKHMLARIAFCAASQKQSYRYKHPNIGGRNPIRACVKNFVASASKSATSSRPSHAERMSVVVPSTLGALHFVESWFKPPAAI